jgi:hypothetical protein
LVITRASHARGHEFDPRLEYSFFLRAVAGRANKKNNTSGEVRTHALKRGPELESGALTTRPQMLDMSSA